MRIYKIQEVKISDIEIGNRHRKEMGDIEGLAQSIEETGLLQPIGITPDNELVFGERRLCAYRDLMKRETIPARIIDVESVLHGEFTENMMRKDFTVSERVAIVEALRSHQCGGDRRSNQFRNRETETLTVDVAAKRVGLGGKDGYARAKKVIDSGVPELVEAMDNAKIAVSAAAMLAEADGETQTACLRQRIDGAKLTGREIKKRLHREERKQEIKALDAQLVSLPRNDDDIRLYHCPFQNLDCVAGISPDSVQLICTDIPYGRDFIEQVEELAALADQVLVPGGLLVAYVGQYRLNEKMAHLDKHLQYQWLATSVWDVAANPHMRLKVISQTIPIVVYSKGRWNPLRKWRDALRVDAQEKNWHEWQRPLAEVEQLIQYFTKPGDLVVDPCGGGFTTAIACHNQKRRFIGCDVVNAAVVNGQKRLDEIRHGQVMLPMEAVTVNSLGGESSEPPAYPKAG